jgi:hypothetical protein
MKQSLALLLMVCPLALVPHKALAQASASEGAIRRNSVALPGSYIVTHIFRRGLCQADS